LSAGKRGRNSRLRPTEEKLSAYKVGGNGIGHLQ
jgi:hypothetical protein